VTASSTRLRIFGSFHRSLRVIGRRGLLVGMIDSVAGMATRDELKEIEEKGEIKRDRAAQIRALMLSAALRKMGALVPRTNAILFCVNQVRENTDVTFGEKTKPPGGRALKFYASIRLKLESLGKIKRTRQGKQYVAGFKIRITAVKNRLARPYQQAEIVLDFERGLLSLEEASKRSRKRK